MSVVVAVAFLCCNNTKSQIKFGEIWFAEADSNDK